MDRLFEIGLTGGIASGKTTAARMFAQRGAGIIDTDTIAHRMLEPGTATYVLVAQKFGTGILNPDGTVNRARLGEIVFNDEQKRHQLNAIVHPAVHEAWLAELKERRQSNKPGVVIVVIPLLYEVGAEKSFDYVVTVGCGEESQQRRLVERGLSASQAAARVRAQWPLTRKVEKANFVIWNESPLDVLEQQVARIWGRFTE